MTCEEAMEIANEISKIMTPKISKLGKEIMKKLTKKLKIKQNPNGSYTIPPEYYLIVSRIKNVLISDLDWEILFPHFRSFN